MPPSVVSAWLMATFQYSPSNSITLADLHYMFSLDNPNEKITKKSLSTNIIKLYGVCSKRKWINGFMESTYPLCYIPKDTKELTFNIPPSVAVISNNDEMLSVSVQSDVIVGNNPVTKQLTFHKANNGWTWDLKCLGKFVKPDTIGISSKIDMNNIIANVNAIVSTTMKLKVCCGKSDKGSPMFPNYVTSETLSMRGNENPEKKYRSKYCLPILPVAAVKNTCYQCAHVRFNKHDDIQSLIEKTADNKSVDDNNNCKKDTYNIINTTIDLDEEESADIEKVIEQVQSLVPEGMRVMLKDQIHNCNVSPSGRRYDASVISMALSIYCRSPKAYQELRDGGMVILPSGRQLRHYKNSCDQSPGPSDENLSWMKAEASRLKQENKLQSDGFYGGILIDEMSIQQDLTIVKCGKEMKMIGNVDLGQTATYIKIVSNEKNEFTLAKYVLQFVFLGHSGFRWLVATYPCNGAQAHELYVTFWPLVDKLEEYGFQVDYVSLDGAISNRQFLKLHFKNFEPEPHNYIITNPIHPRQNKSVIAIMDVKHNIKKIRNGIEKSDGEKKSLKLNGNSIKWIHFIDAYKHDESKVFKTNRKLIEDHVFLSSVSKMRNALAENVLSEDMLWLFKEMGNSDYNGTIELLEVTSKLVKFVHDFRPIVNSSDERLDTIKEILEFFKKWESNAKSNKELLSNECREDIKCYLIGICELFKKLESRGQHSLVPARVNSDAVENVFCQHRAQKNGATTNPTYWQVMNGTNSILLTESTISKKSNTGGSSNAKAFRFHKNAAKKGIRL